MSPEHPLVGEVTGKGGLNRQLYVNNPVAQDSLTEEYLRSTTKFAGDRDPNLGIQSEKVEHRVIMFLRAQGKNSMEIAKITGYSYQWVLQVSRQPWFKKRLIETIQEAGGNAVDKFVQGEVLPSLMTLVEVRDNPDAKEASRVAAANAILDRGLGKPMQHIQTEVIKSATEAQSEMSDIERELEAIRLAQQAAGVVPQRLLS